MGASYHGRPAPDGLGGQDGSRAETEIRNWCESTLNGVLDDTPRDVLFDAYVACVRR